MNKKQLKKLIKLENSDEFKEIMFNHKLNIHYYSDTIIEYIKEYLEIIEEDFNDMDNLKKIFIPKLEYEINKYKKKYKEYQNTITKSDLNYNYNINTVNDDLIKIDQYVKMLSYKSGYEYGKHIFHKWLLEQLKKGFSNGKF